jgi:hypothetical protein
MAVRSFLRVTTAGRLGSDNRQVDVVGQHCLGHPLDLVSEKYWSAQISTRLTLPFTYRADRTTWSATGTLDHSANTLPRLASPALPSSR